jgi:hypothetical protein
VDRVPKRAYAAFRDASRPVLVTARVERSVVEPGEVVLPVFVVNDRAERFTGPVTWAVHDAGSSIITPDPEGFRIGLAMPDDGVAVAVARDLRAQFDGGAFTVDAPAESSTHVGDVTVHLTPGTARTVVFGWGDETNAVHLLCPPAATPFPPGLRDVG